MQDNVESIILKYFWVVLILVTFLNVISAKRHSPQGIKDDPKALKEYNNLLLRILFGFNLPWIIMGLGIIFGSVKNMSFFFRPRDGNPFVIAWWVSWWVLWTLCVYWVFFCKGAEKVAKYQMLHYYYTFTKKSGYLSNPLKIKLFFIVMWLGFLYATFIYWK